MGDAALADEAAADGLAVELAGVVELELVELLQAATEATKTVAARALPTSVGTRMTLSSQRSKLRPRWTFAYT
jgi:hypothetical protein